MQSHMSIAMPNPLILFSFKMEIKKASATKMNESKAPVKINSEKSQISGETKMPYVRNGINVPATKLSESEKDKPRYCPMKILLRLIGCDKSNSINSREL